MNRSLGINEKNRKLLEALNRSGKNMFTAKEASRIIGLTINSTRLFLAYCTRRGWLARVKRGLYTCVPLGTINPQEYKEIVQILIENHNTVSSGIRSILRVYKNYKINGEIIEYRREKERQKEERRNQ